MSKLQTYSTKKLEKSDSAMSMLHNFGLPTSGYRSVQTWTSSIVATPSGAHCVQAKKSRHIE